MNADWQPIETAPEHRMILVYVPDAEREIDRIQTAHYGITSNQKRLWTIGGLAQWDVGRPTRWTELPLPPGEGAPIDPGLRDCVDSPDLLEVARMVDAWSHGLRHRTAHESAMVDAARTAIAKATTL